MNSKQKILVLAIATALSLGTSNALFADSKGNKPDDKGDKGKPVATETSQPSPISTSDASNDDGDDNSTDDGDDSSDEGGDDSSDEGSDDSSDEGDDSATSTDNSKKTLVCHNGQELEVAKAALGGHLGHGDTEGACPEPVAVTEEEPTVDEEEVVTEEEVTVDEEVVTEEEVTTTDEEVVTEEEVTTTDEEVVTEEEVTTTDEEVVTEEEVTTTDEEVVTEEEVTAIDEEVVTEEEVTVDEEVVALEPEQQQLRQALDTVGEELVAIEEPTEQLALLETQPIERTFYSEQHNDLAYLPKVSVSMLGQLVSYAVLMQGIEFVNENGEVDMEYTVTAVTPIDTVEDENTADYSTETNSLDVPIVDVVDESGAIVAFKVTLETVSTDPLIFRIKLSQATDDTAATDVVVDDTVVVEDTTATDVVVDDTVVVEDTAIVDGV